ncbi:unnamed protein product, partial [Chrysoparadoxa australica]
MVWWKGWRRSTKRVGLVSQDLSQRLIEGGGHEGGGVYQVTHAGLLWGILAVSWSQIFYHITKTLFLVATREKGGDKWWWGATGHIIQALGWGMASGCASYDFWSQALPSYVGSADIPKRKRLQVWLWMYFVLSLACALPSYIFDYEADRHAGGFMAVVGDAELWSLLLSGIAVIIAGFSAFRGSKVRRLDYAPTAEFTCGFLSAMTFSWFGPVMRVGQRRYLDFVDLPHLNHKERSKYNTAALQHELKVNHRKL